MIGPALFIVFDTLQDEKLNLTTKWLEKKVHIFIMCSTLKKNIWIVDNAVKMCLDKVYLSKFKYLLWRKYS